MGQHEGKRYSKFVNITDERGAGQSLVDYHFRLIGEFIEGSMVDYHFLMIGEFIEGSKGSITVARCRCCEQKDLTCLLACLRKDKIQG